MVSAGVYSNFGTAHRLESPSPGCIHNTNPRPGGVVGEEAVEESQMER